MTRESDEANEAKRKLEELFGNKGAAPATTTTDAPGRPSTPPPHSSQPRRPGRVFASPRKSLGRSPSEYRMRLERLRIARNPEEIEQAADTFLKHHQLPDDVDILYKVMQHPSEKVVRDALGQISSLLMQGRLGGSLLLEDRLKELRERTQEDATLSYIDGLRSQLEAMKKE